MTLDPQGLDAVEEAVRSIDDPHVMVPASTIARAAVTAYLSCTQIHCLWSKDDDVWSTECGEDWQFIDGGPAENRQRFCHWCGHPIEVVEDSP